MKVSWWQLLKAAPEIKGTVATVEGNKDWYRSQSILYQLIKTAVTLLSALGIYGVMSAEDMQTISMALAVAIPAALTVCDMVAGIWIRLRTSGAITGTVEAAKVAEVAATCKVEAADVEHRDA